MNSDTNKIHLRSGITCSLLESHCLDMKRGQTFWDSLPDDNYNCNEYEILHEGFVNKTRDKNTQNPDILYSLTTQDMTFVLT